MFPELHYLWCGNGILGRRLWIVYLWKCCCRLVAHPIIHAPFSHTLRDTLLLPNTLLQALTDAHSNIEGKFRQWWQLRCASGGWSVLLLLVSLVVKLWLSFGGWWWWLKIESKQRYMIWLNKKEVENCESSQVALGYSYAPVRNLHYWTALRTPEGLLKRKSFF